MAQIEFIGEAYYGDGLRCPQPGVYEADEAKIAQVLNDFPHEFRSVESTHETNSESEPKTINLKKANKEQLLSHARELGVTGVTDTNTNDEIIKAIDAHTAQKEG